MKNAHPLSMTAAAARNARKAGPEVEVKEPKTVKPMGGSRRKKIYKTQGGKPMTAAQARRYGHKVAANGYIPK